MSSYNCVTLARPDRNTGSRHSFDLNRNSNAGATTDPKILDILFRINQGTSLDTLAKHIEQQLKKREFCVVLEDEPERCCPRKNSNVQNERGKSKLLPNLMGGVPPSSIPILVQGQYSGM
jgi:hypothetical protein